MSSQPSLHARLLTMTRAEFTARFGSSEFTGAIYGYTREADTHAVLSLLLTPGRGGCSRSALPSAT